MPGTLWGEQRRTVTAGKLVREPGPTWAMETPGHQGGISQRPHGPSPTHHLLAGQRRVPGKEERACLLVERDEHGPVGGPGLRPAHKADHTLVGQTGFGRTGGSVLIHQL